MLNNDRKQHIAGLLMLSLTAIFWGAGFVLNDNLLNAAFNLTPNLINTIRFGIATVLLAAIFNRKLTFNKKTLLYAGLGGLMLFGGFTLQLLGLKRTTPSHNGFFTVAYVVFVPFIAWILRKQRPSWVTFAGVAVALAGCIILNIDGFSETDATVSDTLIGDLLTLAGAVMFAGQIALTDYAYAKGEIDYPNMTFWQILTATILFALYSVTVESGNYNAVTFDPSYCIWRLVVVSVGGTAFAYLAQGYAQKHLAPTETSIILACESPIGALLSIILGVEPFLWNTAVGGALVVASVLILELAPYLLKRKNKRNNGAQDGNILKNTMTTEKDDAEPADKNNSNP